MSVQEFGRTIKDAQKFLRRAKAVYVAVPTGFDDWFYTPLSRADARRLLQYAPGCTGRDLLCSRLEHREGVEEFDLYIGSVYTKEQTTRIAKKESAP